MGIETENHSMIRVVIAEEMGLLRGALRVVLSNEDDLDVMADLPISSDILPVLRTTRPDVLVMGIEWTDPGALAVLRWIDEERLGAAVLALSARRTPEALRLALRCGVRGFVGRDVPPNELVQAVRAVAGGERVIDPAAAVAVLNPPTSPLTRREAEILRAAAEGLPLKEIAGRLFLSHGTVRNYLSAILRKTGTRNRLEAVRLAQRQGWL